MFSHTTAMSPSCALSLISLAMLKPRWMSPSLIDVLAIPEKHSTLCFSTTFLAML